jgi:predicted ATPase/class 3 adenylate cyclase
MCGTCLVQFCPNCNFANPREYRFCCMCGSPLAEQTHAGEVVLPPGLELPVPFTDQVANGEIPVPAGAASFTPANPPTQKLAGERRVATVILADVKNSTDLMEQIGTEAWVEIMNHVFQLLETEIYRFGGRVDQFRGDGLIAFFGAPIAHEDDPERAVLAAIMMQKSIKRYAAELNERNGIDLNLRVGVNTGEVIVASVGDNNQYVEDTAMGEAAAMAARMETAAEPGTVLVSENTYRLVESKFKWQSLGAISVKGVSQPISVYRPLDLQTRLDQTSDKMTYEIPISLIGRQNEFQTLKRCFEDLSGKRGGIALITGDKGMGKTFLINQVSRHITLQKTLLSEPARDGSDEPLKAVEEQVQAKITWLRGICRSYDQSWPYSMWLDMFHRWLDMQPDEPREEARDRLRQKAEELWGDRFDKFYPYLAIFLALPLEKTFNERVRYLDAQGLQRQFFLSVRSWVEALANRGPLVAIFSDLQWVDTTSLELLKYCLSLSDNEPVLWLIVFRPDRTSPVWEFNHYVETEYPHRVTRIELLPLSNEEISDFMDQIIGPEVLSERTCDLVIEKAEGNPYYIRELIHGLIAQGVLEQDQDGTWRETRPVSSLDLPDSLQSLLLERIDRLSTEERHVLQMAAVIGPLFWRNLLAALAQDSDSLQDHLTALQRMQLIRERNQVLELGMEYSFNSSLIRDVAYESLLTTQRTAWHLKAAEYLENCTELVDWSNYVGLIAYHYRHAGKRDKELLYTFKAAEQARNVYANAEALSYYTRAIELLDDMEAHARSDGRRFSIRTQRFEVLNRRSQLNYLMGDIPAGDADARALLNLARQIADHPSWLIDALLAQPEIRNTETREQLDAGLNMSLEALSLSEQLGDQPRELYSLMAIGNLKTIIRDPSWLDYGQRALELARQLGDRRAEVNILLGIGSTYGMDNLKRNMEYLEAALAIAKQLDDRGTELQLLYAMGTQYERNGDYYRLLTEYEQQRLLISREIGNRLEEGNALMYCGQIQGLYLGDYEGGLALVEESMNIWEGSSAMLFPMLRVAQIKIEIGQFSEAEAILEKARPLGESNVYNLGLAGLNLVLTILNNTIGDEAHLRSTLELATQISQMVANNLVSRQYLMAADCAVAAARLGLAGLATDEEDRQRYLQQAFESSLSALEAYNQFGFVQIVECVSEGILYQHGLCLKANDRSAEASEFLQQAHDEMMRKFALIPTGSLFRRTYLENIRLHNWIRQDYANLVTKALAQESDSS